MVQSTLNNINFLRYTLSITYTDPLGDLQVREIGQTSYILVSTSKITSYILARTSKITS